MRAADFDQIVEQAFRRIPARFRSRMQNVAVVVEDEPSPRQRGRTPDASTLLGLYEGRPLKYRGVSEGFQLPDRVCRNIVPAGCSEPQLSRPRSFDRPVQRR